MTCELRLHLIERERIIKKGMEREGRERGRGREREGGDNERVKGEREGEIMRE